MIAVPIIVFVLLNALTVLISKKSFGITLPITMIVTGMIYYVSQFLFNTFKIGFYSCCILLVVAVILIFIHRKKKQFLGNFFSLGFYAAIFVGIFFLFVDFHRSFTASDEFSHWGYMVKEMMRLDTFYSSNDSNLLFHKDYPPFISLIELIWCDFSGGKYAEDAITLALHFFELSFVIPIISERFDKIVNKVSHRIIVSLLVTLCVCFVIIYFDAYSIFSTVLTDLCVPLYYVYGIFIILDDKLRDSAIGFIFLLLVQASLIISKQISLAYVILIAFLYCLFCFSSNSKEIRNNVVYVLRSLILILIPAASYFLWRSYIKALR